MNPQFFHPVHYAVNPAGEICLGSTPDETYVVRGEYRKAAPQALSQNADVPGMPERFHEVLAWYALLLLAEHDEAASDPGEYPADSP